MVDHERAERKQTGAQGQVGRRAKRHIAYPTRKIQMQLHENRRPPSRITSDREGGALGPRASGHKSLTSPEGEPAFYAVAELAIRWRICERQVRRYIASEELAATRFGRSVRVSAANVAEFEESRTAVK
jgi:excisionase family DNA binding protein